MLRVSGLKKKYDEFVAVDNVSFDVRKGSTVLLLGPNGAGKTTIIKCVMGLLNFDGLIEVDGFDAVSRGEEVRSRIGYLPQNLSFYETLTVLQQANFIASLKGVSPEVVKEKLEMVRLWEFGRRRVRSLSSGMRQRLAVAFALLNDPPVLIFDEPVSNVDLEGQLEFQELLEKFSRSGKTILITTHTLGLDENAETAIVIDKGRVVGIGPPVELLNEIDARDTVYLKVNKGDLDRALQTIKKEINDSAKTKGDWIIFSAAPAMKSNVIRMLAEVRIAVNDVIIEPATIQGEYIKFLGKKRS